MSAERRSGTTTIVWIVVVLGVILLTVLLAPSDSTERPYDLDSPAPEGYRGLRLLVEGLGASVDEVDAGAVDQRSVDRYDVVFVPDGGAPGRVVARWRRFVEAGGRLVLGAPLDDFGPVGTDVDDVPPYFGGLAMSAGECDLDTIDGAGRITLPPLYGGVVVGRGDTSCYGDGEHAIVVRRTIGDGEVVVLASPDLLTNQTMGAPPPDEPVGPVRGNAVIAQRLLAPDLPGGARLAVVTEGAAPIADGTRTVTDHMSWGVKLGLLQLVIAFGYLTVSRARRHGRVVTEEAPVDIAGSAFVQAVGGLLERQGDCARVAEILRDGECRALARRLGVPPTISRSELAAVVAARTERDTAAVERLLTGPVVDESGLVELTRELDSLRQEALHV